MKIRKWLVSKIRNTPMERLAFELDERLHQLKGLCSGSYSQHGEDRIILEILGDRKGTYVDVGANYPIKLSNTYLLYRLGWSGLTIEPIPRLSNRHRKIRPRDIHLNSAVGPKSAGLLFYELDDTVLSTFDVSRMHEATQGGSRLKKVHQINVVPLHELINQSLCSAPVDVLTVDTEGFDLQVLQSNNWTLCRPKIVIFEDNNTSNAEPSPARLYLEKQGYKFDRCAGCNVIMVRPDVS